MHSFNPKYLVLKLSVPTAWLLGQCMELKGKQAYLLNSQSDLMLSLQSLAKIQSVESSNRIEGVVTSRDRLGPLLAEKISPISRPEEEILGYKKAVEWIHENFAEISITPENILRLHKICQ